MILLLVSTKLPRLRRCGLRRHVAALKARTCPRTPNYPANRDMAEMNRKYTNYANMVGRPLLRRPDVWAVRGNAALPENVF